MWNGVLSTVARDDRKPRVLRIAARRPTDAKAPAFSGSPEGSPQSSGLKADVISLTASPAAAQGRGGSSTGSSPRGGSGTPERRSSLGFHVDNPSLSLVTGAGTTPRPVATFLAGLILARHLSARLDAAGPKTI